MLIVSGDVPSPFALTAGDIAKMPRATAVAPEKKGGKTGYEGVLLREILKWAGAPLDKELRGKALATNVLANARDGCQVVFGLAEVAPEFANEPILVAGTRDGKPLPDSQGPFRLICPNDKEGARSVKMLEEIVVVRLRKEK